MPHGINRRDFLRYSAVALGVLGLAPLLPLSPQPARAAPPPPLAVAPPGPSSVTLTGLLGAPVDISITNDGVQWLVTDAGAPHTFDAIHQVWQPFGPAIDAAAFLPYLDAHGSPANASAFFHGPDLFITGAAASTPIAALWQTLPGFQSNIHGALQYSFGALLIQQGRATYVEPDGLVADPQPLETLFGWWPGGAWQAGKFSYIIAGRPTNPSQAPTSACFVFGNDYLQADLLQSGWSFSPPRPLSSFYQGAALDLLQQDGIQAVLVDGAVDDPAAPFTVIRGPALYAFPNATAATLPQPTYIAQHDPNWPQSWHPILAQAPSGRMGDLWSLNPAGVPLHHDGASWTPAPLPNALAATAIAAGADGSVFATAAGNLYQRQPDATWTLFATSQGAPWLGLAVVDASQIWLRDSQGGLWANVWSVSTAQFIYYALGAAAHDIGANRDGTLWACDGTAQLYRAVTESGLPAAPIDSGATNVLKVTSTSFGTALYLATFDGQTTLFRYTSPYVFKTADSYFSGQSPLIATGASSLFMFSYDSITGGFVVALDAESGAERWRQPYPVATDGFGYAPVYDPQHQLVYIFPAGAAVQALAAQTGAIVWSLTVPQPIVATPILTGGLLLLASYLLLGSVLAEVTVSAVDTLDALQRATQGEPVLLRFQTSADVGSGAQNSFIHPPLPPVTFNGNIYSPIWEEHAGASSSLYILQINAATGNLTNTILSAGQFFGDFLPPLTPIASQLTIPSGQLVPAIILSGPAGLVAAPLDGITGPLVYTRVSAVNPITTPLLYLDGNICFGDASGNLHVVDSSFNPIAASPFPVTNGAAIAALTNVPVADDVVFAFVGQTAELGFFSTTGGATLLLPTDQTISRCISPVIDGVLYVGGRYWQDSGATVGEVFAIRTGDLSALRDFIVESQLMQDYADNAVPIACYQTHVTVVDDNKVPQPLTSLKLWADAPLTLLVAGQTATIGPDSPLATQTDASGTLTIASDAADLFATPLRLWAAFMDPFERIVIYPDTAFHARLPSMTADPDNDDPSTINLATGTAYGGASPLLSQDQAQSAAQQIGAVTSALGLGSSNTATASQRYKAYPALPGYLHFSANLPATRAVTPQGSYGLSLDESNIFTAISPTTAATLIDELQGDVTVLVTVPLRSFFKDIWHDIKRGVAKVAKAIVSVGTAVYVGLTYVVDGVTHVLRQVVHDIEDVASLIGAFFIKLIDDIQKIIELLSLLLHFDQIIATYNRLKPAVLEQFKFLESLIPNQIVPDVNGFFAAGEQAILAASAKAKQAVDANVTCQNLLTTQRFAAAASPISCVPGVGATTTTVFTAGPKQGGPASSHAVHATWGLHKVKDNYKQAHISAGATATGAGLTQALTTFFTTLTDDPSLQAALAQTQNDFARTFTVSSTTEFLKMAVVDLLDILQDLVISSLAVSKAFLDALLIQAGDLVAFFVDPTTGILTRTLDIPIISDLFQLIVKDDLTFFNLLILVASIPITILYRVIEGAWPAEQIPLAVTGALPDLLTMTAMARVWGLLDVVCYVANTFFAPVADMFITATETPRLVTLVLLSSALCTTASSTYAIDTQAEGGNMAMQIFQLVINAISEIPDKSIEEEFKPLAPVLLMFAGLGAVATYAVGVADDTMDGITFAVNLMSEIPSVVRPLQYLAKTYPFATTILLGTIDELANMITAAAAGGALLVNWDAQSPPTASPTSPEPSLAEVGRAYLPFVFGAR